MSQVKFYKGIDDDTASQGKNSSNDTVASGGILFSSTGSGRIYTKENDGVVEYYKLDLEFLNLKTVNSSLKSIVGNIEEGDRVMDVLKKLLFVVYAPLYYAPSVTASHTATLKVRLRGENDYSTAASSGDIYLIRGGACLYVNEKVELSNPVAAKTVATKTNGETGEFTVNGGDLLLVKHGNSVIEKVNDKYTIIKTNPSSNFDNNIGTSTTIDAGLNGNNAKLYFLPGQNNVKDSAGDVLESRKVSTENRTTSLYSSTGLTTDYVKNINNTYVIAGNSSITIEDTTYNNCIELTKSFSSLSRTINIYLPIFISNNITVEKLNIADGASTSDSNNTNYNYLSIAEDTEDEGKLKLSNGTSLGDSVCYSIENTLLKSSPGTIYFKFLMPAKSLDNPNSGITKILLPEELGIDNTILYLKGNDGLLHSSTISLSATITEDVTNYYLKSDGTFSNNNVDGPKYKMYTITRKNVANGDTWAIKLIKKV